MSKRSELHNSISVLTIGVHLTHSLIFAIMSLGSDNYFFVALARNTYMEFADTIDNLSVEIARLRKKKRRSGTHRNHILLHFRSHVLNHMVYAFSGRACCSLSAYCGRLTFFFTSGISDVCDAHEIARLCFEKLSADTSDIPLGASGAASETSENLSAGMSLLPEFCSCLQLPVLHWTRFCLSGQLFLLSLSIHRRCLLLLDRYDAPLTASHVICWVLKSSLDLINVCC
jgi:hypothetical protein